MLSTAVYTHLTTRSFSELKLEEVNAAYQKFNLKKNFWTF